MSLQPQPASISAAAAVPACETSTSGYMSKQQSALVCAGRAQGVLKGKNLGLLCDDPSQPEALLAYRAAVELGAHVSLVRPRFEEQGEAAALAETAHMLGRLYDAVACVALPRAVTDELRALARVPVIDELDIGWSAAASRVAAAAGTGLEAPRGDERLFLWQLALISGFASL
jgi:ornithine carbamoyltransferase